MRFLEPCDPEQNRDLIGEDDEVLRSAFREAHGRRAEVELARYRVAAEISETTGREEDEAFERFEAIPLQTAEDLKAYQDYMLEHADTVDEAKRSVILHRLADRLADLLGQRLAARNPPLAGPSWARPTASTRLETP